MEFALWSGPLGQSGLKVPAGEKEDDLSVGQVGKRGRAQMTEPDLVSCDAVAKRQRAWLTRGSEDGSARPATWRPIKFHRLSTKWWLVSLDNQVQTSTRFAGLDAFNWTPLWPKDWRLWPCLGLSMDLGSDGVSAFHAMCYKWRVNVFLLADESHSIKKSFNEMLRMTGLWELFLLMLVTFNLEFGPRQEESRRTEIRHALQSCYAGRRPSQCPLYLELVPRMVEELEGCGQASFPRQEPVEDELWSFLGERNRHGAMGRRVCMARYGAPLDAAAKHRGFWSVNLWERLYVALEHDHMKGRRCAETFSVRKKDADEAPSSSTTSKRAMAIDEKAIRSAAANALVVSVLTLQQRHHQRCIDIACAAAAPLTAFHTAQNREQRSAQGCSQHVIDMCSGGYLRHLDDIVGVLSSPAALRGVGFALPTKAGARSAAPVRLDAGLKEDMLEENEYADLLGQSVMSLVVARAQRGLWRWSWPAAMFQVISEKPDISSVVQQFVEDERIFKELQGMKDMHAALLQVERRHVFKHVSNLQLSEAISELGPEVAAYDADFRRLLRERSLCIGSTQIVEDMNALQSIKSLAPCRRYRRPASAMATILEQDMPAVRHKFDSVVPELQAPTKGANLPRFAFEPLLKRMSMPFDQVVSTKQCPDWYSPAAERMTTPAADLSMLRTASESGDLGLIGSAWLGAACDSRHRLAIGFRAGKPIGEASWFLALHHWPKSACLLWPVRLKRMGNEQFFELQTGLSELIVKPIFDLSEDSVVCATYVWRSWFWQVEAGKDDTSALAPAVRPFVSGAVAPFREVASRNAWWSMPRSTVYEFSRHFGLDSAPGDSLLELLSKMGQAFAGADADGMLDILHKRVSEGGEPSEAAAAMLEIDEALEVVEQQDASEIHREQAKVRERLTEWQALRGEYKARARAVRAEQAAATKQRKRARAAPERKPLPHHLEQRDAKKFLPPNSTLWRSKTRGEWNGQFRQNKRVWEPFYKHGGSESALRVCLRRLWSQHLAYEGLDESECPFSGLFAD